MLKTCALILPALIPSWRFFQTVEASPRVEWTLLATARETPSKWHPLRPRPDTVTPLQMLARLFWNPAGNDAPYITSCAERIALGTCPHSVGEITTRILRHITTLPIQSCTKLMQFRLVFVAHDGAGLTRETFFLSTPVPTLR
jgi:hypothetical protein